MRDDEEQSRRMRFLLALRQAGVTDARVLNAMEAVDRAHFAPREFAALAIEDRALPLPESAQMTPPSLVARMIAQLQVADRHTVLEIGAGSGFATAILARLARRVISLERRRAVLAYARERLGGARIMNAYLHVADGHEGWAPDAPYDRIIVWGALTQTPTTLLAQLAPDGLMIAPKQSEAGTHLTLFAKDKADEPIMTIRESVIVKPLETGVAEAL
jgi:protein-L-isoaspartate(D-aspartate) O-methyltransferase